MRTNITLLVVEHSKVLLLSSATLLFIYLFIIFTVPVYISILQICLQYLSAVPFCSSVCAILFLSSDPQFHSAAPGYSFFLQFQSAVPLYSSIRQCRSAVLFSSSFLQFCSAVQFCSSRNINGPRGRQYIT